MSGLRIFWRWFAKPYNSEDIRRFGGSYRLYFQSRRVNRTRSPQKWAASFWFLACLTLRPSRWSRHLLLKIGAIFKQHGFITQKTVGLLLNKFPHYDLSSSNKIQNIFIQLVCQMLWRTVIFTLTPCKWSLPTRLSYQNSLLTHIVSEHDIWRFVIPEYLEVPGMLMGRENYIVTWMRVTIDGIWNGDSIYWPL
jgi:hypothetical protein